MENANLRGHWSVPHLLHQNLYYIHTDKGLPY